MTSAEFKDNKPCKWMPDYDERNVKIAKQIWNRSAISRQRKSLKIYSITFENFFGQYDLQFWIQPLVNLFKPS
jgi:hypothetical protein